MMAGQPAGGRNFGNVCKWCGKVMSMHTPEEAQLCKRELDKRGWK